MTYQLESEGFVDDPAVDRLAEKLADRMAEEQEVQADLQEVVRHAEQIEQEARRQEAAADEAERKAGRDRLVPGSNPGAAVRAAAAEAATKRERAEELRAEEGKLRDRLQALRDDKKELAAKLVRQLAGQLRKRLNELRERYGELVLGQRALPEILKDVDRAEEKVQRLRADVSRALGVAGAEYEERRRLRGYLEEKLELEPAERLGYLLRELCAWSRLPKSPVSRLWKLTDVPLREEGSIRSRRPVPTDEGTLQRLSEGRWPTKLTL